MTKIGIIAAATILGSANLAAAQKVDCNPAFHCAPTSLNCMPCPPYKKVDGSYVEDETCTVASGPGSCASTVPLTANPNSRNEVRYGVPYNERCRRIVDASINERANNPPHESYIRACREGTFTCNDGYCEPIANYPSECYGGLLDSSADADADYPCNIFYQEPLSLASGVWESITGNKQSPEEKWEYLRENFCLDHGGIRYHPFRCERTALGLGIAETECDGGVARGDICETEEQATTYVTGPGDACYAECDEGSDEASLPGCCVVPGSDVCSSVTIKTETTPPVEDDHGNDANGVEISFKFKAPTELDDASDCCCEFICTCFGDPHCSSFFGDYQVSQDNTGGYQMIDDASEGFTVEADLAAPGGVNKAFRVTMDADEYIIDAERCVENDYQLKNGEQVDISSEPGFHYEYTSPSNSNQDLAVNPSLLVVKKGPYTLRLTCIRFQMTLGPQRGWYNRIDATLKLKDVLVPEGTPDECCPSLEVAFAELQNRSPRVRGFCVRQRGSTEDGLPNPRDPSTLGIHGRTLHEKVVGAVQSAPGKRIGRILNDDEDCNDELVNQYAHHMKITHAEALVLCDENGAESIENAVQFFDDTCKSLATDEVFQLENKGPCDQGLTLQRSVDGGDFEDILFFPADIVYCDDKIFIPFDHVNPPLSKNDELRLSLCQPDITNPQCEDVLDKCQKTYDVDGIAVVKYTYGIGLYQTYQALLEHANKECVCGDSAAEIADCYRQCLRNGDCPAVGTCDA